MEKRLTGETAVITGATGGIGRKIAEAVAREGAVPVLLGRNTDKLEEVSRDIYVKHHIFAPFYPLDLKDKESVSTVFKQIYRDTGNITILVNNAGFGLFEYADETEDAVAENMFRVNVFGSIACTQQVLPFMKKNEKGSIIFISSLAGKVPTPKASIYSATKHAVIGYAGGLRMELAHSGVSVSVINPGPVRTEFFNIADKSGDYEKNIASVMIEPDTIAEETVNMILRPKAEINVPRWMGAGAKVYQLFPGLIEKLAGPRLSRK